MLDENEFFREVTLRICGTLEIETALWRCYKYLNQFFPVDIAVLHYLIPEENSGIGFAEATAQGGRLAHRKGFIPPEFLDRVNRGEMPDEIIQNRANEQPWGKFLLEAGQVRSKASTMTARLIVDNTWLGGVTFIANGWDRYKEGHRKLLQLLRVPFAFALSNARRYLQLLEIKELLADDNRYLQKELQARKSTDIIGHD